MYLKDAPEWSRSRGSLFSFVATTQEIQEWILIFSDLDFVVYREETDERGWRVVKVYELEEFQGAVMRSPKEPISYFGPRDFLDAVDLPRRYPPGECDFTSFMIFNGMIRLYHSKRRNILKQSIFAVVHRVVNFESMLEYINDDAKKHFAKLKRTAQKSLIYHIRLLTPPHPISELVFATEEAIKAHHEESDWLPGPKKEVKPRARKKKT